MRQAKPPIEKLSIARDSPDWPAIIGVLRPPANPGGNFPKGQAFHGRCRTRVLPPDCGTKGVDDMDTSAHGWMHGTAWIALLALGSPGIAAADDRAGSWESRVDIVFQ